MDTGEIPTRVGEFGAWCRCRIFGRSAHMCNAKQFGCAWFCLAHRRIPENGSWDSRRDSLQATAVVRYGGYGCCALPGGSGAAKRQALTLLTLRNLDYW